MLKKGLILFLFLTHSALSKAQYEHPFFEYGPKAGLSLNWIQNESDTKVYQKPSLQYSAGVFTRLNYKRWTLQPELLYQQKGTTIKGNTNSKYVFKYISAPVLLQYKMAKGIYLETGPEFSRAINKNSHRDGINVFGPDAGTDKAWIVGTRIDMLDGFSLFALNIRYTHGLTNVSSNNFGGSKPYHFHNRNVNISLSFAFSEFQRWRNK